MTVRESDKVTELGYVPSMATMRHATQREFCPTCGGLGEVVPPEVNPDRPTLAAVMGESVVCSGCLGLGLLYSTPQPSSELVPA